MESFVDLYCEKLCAKLDAKKIKVDLKKLRAEFNVCWLDYVRVIITGLWKRLDEGQVR